MIRAEILVRPAWTWAVAAVVVLLGAIPPFASRLRPDTAWLLYAAEHLLRGSRLYVDLVEINPPLILWLDTIPVMLAHLLHVPSGAVFNALTLALALGSVWCCATVLIRIFPDDPELRRGVVLLLLFALVPLAREDFGEREHLFLALILPYLFLTVQDITGVDPRPGASLLAGVAAGIGIALKPYFLVLWAGVEAVALIHRRSGRSWIRIETLAIAAVGILYLLAVVLWAPAYFDVVRTMAGPYYEFVRNSLAATVLLGDGAQLPVLALVACLGLRSTARHRPVWSVLASAMGAVWLCAVMQQKGWRYHFYPALALSAVLLGVMALDRRAPLGGIRRLYAGLTVAGTLGVALVTAAACVRQILDPRNPRYDADPDMSRLIPVVSQAAGQHVLMLSWNAASAFPLMTYAGVENASRFNHLWILGATYRQDLGQPGPIRYHPRSRMTPLERQLLDAVVEDMERTDPAMIVALRPGPDRPPLGLRRLDFIDYFLRDCRFARLFARYTFEGQVGEYWIFRRVAPGAPIVPPPTRPGPRI